MLQWYCYLLVKVYAGQGVRRALQRDEDALGLCCTHLTVAYELLGINERSVVSMTKSRRFH